MTKGREPTAARRPVRHLPRRSHAAIGRLCGGAAAGGGRLRGHRSRRPDLLRPARLQRRRPRELPKRSRCRPSPPSTGFDYVVAPSGSCAAMLKLHYPRLMAGDRAGRGARQGLRRARPRARLVPCRCARPDGERAGLLRRPRRLPRRLLGPARARRQAPAARAPRRAPRRASSSRCPTRQACCGFGGLFSVKYPRYLRCDRRKQDGGHRRRRAGAAAGAAISAACSASPASSRAKARASPAATLRRCWPAR